MNPDTLKFESLFTAEETAERERQAKALKEQVARMQGQLYRPNGEPVPRHWSQFQKGERVVVKDTTFVVAHINESTLILEPASLDLDAGGESNEQDSRRNHRRGRRKARARQG